MEGTGLQMEGKSIAMEGMGVQVEGTGLQPGARHHKQVFSSRSFAL